MSIDNVARGLAVQAGALLIDYLPAIAILSANVGPVTAVAGIVTQVTTVAASIASVNTVASIAANVSSVADNSANITVVATNLLGTNTIGTVAANIANINTVGSAIGSVNTVAADLALGSSSLITLGANGVNFALLTQAPSLLTFASTTDALSNGVIGNSAITGGSGGTNGTFTGTVTGGGGTGAAFRFVVAGGAVTQIVWLSKGKNYTSAPSLGFTASTGLTGSSASAIIGPNTVDGQYFSVIGVGQFLNSAGTAVAVASYNSPRIATTTGLIGVGDAQRTVIATNTTDATLSFDPTLPVGATGTIIRKGSGELSLDTLAKGRMANVLNGVRLSGIWGQVDWTVTANPTGSSAEVVIAGAVIARPATPAPVSGASIRLYSRDLVGGYGNFFNRAEVAALPTSYWGPPRPTDSLYRVGPGVTGIAGNSLTITYDIVGEDGAPRAMRAVYASGSSPTVFFGNPKLPPGTYTFQIRSKSNSGSPTVGVSLFTTGSSNTAVSIGTDFTSVSKTITLAAETAMSCELRGTTGTAFDVTIDQVAVFAAATVQPFEVPTKHLARREGLFPTTGNIVNSSGTVYTGGHIWLSAADVAPTAITIVAAVKSDSTAETTAKLFSIVNELEAGSELNSASGGLFFGTYGAAFACNGTGNAGTAGTGSFATLAAGPFGAGWVVLTAAMSANGCDLYVNGFKVCTSTGTWWNTGGYRALELLGRGRLPAAALPGDFAYLSVFDSKLSAVDVAQEYTLAKAQVEEQGRIFNDLKNFGIYEGDSITWSSGDGPSGLGGWAARMGRLLAPRLQAANVSIPGSGIGLSGTGGNPPPYSPSTNLPTDINSAARRAVVAGKIAEAVARGVRPIVTLLTGANTTPISSADALVKAQAVRDYWAWARSLGAKVMGCSITDQSTYSANQRTWVAQFNAALLAAYNAGECDAFADFAANPNLNTWSSTYFSDFVHPSLAGHVLMGSIAATAITPALLA